MDVPHFIEKNFQMGTSDMTKLKKKFSGTEPSSKVTWKTKWYHSCGCCDGSRSCEQNKSVTDKYFEKRLWALITFRYRKFSLPLQYLSDSCLREKHLKLSD